MPSLRDVFLQLSPLLSLKTARVRIWSAWFSDIGAKQIWRARQNASADVGYSAGELFRCSSGIFAIKELYYEHFVVVAMFS